jgi:hypothetical protein
MINNVSFSHLGRKGGFTLMEVVIVSALLLAVIAGLAGTVVVTTRTNSAAAGVGVNEAAIRVVLDGIVGDIRVRGLDSVFVCEEGSEGRSGLLNGVDWVVSHVSVPGLAVVSCLSIPELTFRVTGRIVEGGVVFERDSVVGLGSSGDALIEWFVFSDAPSPRPVLPSRPVEVRKFVREGDSVSVEWKLFDSTPVGTVTLLNDEAVVTGRDLVGSQVLQLVASSDLVLRAVAPSGGFDEAVLDVVVGSAPLIERFVVEPAVRQYYIPNNVFQADVRVVGSPLVLTSAGLAPESGASVNLLAGVLGVEVVDGLFSLDVPGLFEDDFLTVDVSAASEGGLSFRSFRVQRCPAPVLSLSASPNEFTPPGGVTRLFWSVANVDSVRYPGSTVEFEFQRVVDGVEGGWLPVVDSVSGLPLVFGRGDSRFVGWDEGVRETLMSLDIGVASNGRYDFRLVATNCPDRSGEATNSVTTSPVVVVPIVPPPPPASAGGPCSIVFFGTDHLRMTPPQRPFSNYDPVELEGAVRDSMVYPRRFVALGSLGEDVTQYSAPPGRNGWLYVHEMWVTYFWENVVTGSTGEDYACYVSRDWITEDDYDNSSSGGGSGGVPPAPVPPAPPSGSSCDQGAVSVGGRCILGNSSDPFVGVVVPPRLNADGSFSFEVWFDEVKADGLYPAASGWSLNPVEGAFYSYPFQLVDGMRKYSVEVYVGYWYGGSYVNVPKFSGVYSVPVP